MIKSFINAFRGLRDGLFFERNISILSLSALTVIVLSFLLGISNIEISIIILTSTVVIALELINLAFEKYIDLLSPQKDDAIKFTKDVLAGATLIVSIASIFIGILILFPPLIELF